ncbi:hypothetical protein FB451DRAFT_1403882 [Mycena latifolia]|nr:hypothetical protein FB451DRAFT_1403882 [Mycena latifolia]
MSPLAHDTIQRPAMATDNQWRPPAAASELSSGGYITHFFRDLPDQFLVNLVVLFFCISLFHFYDDSEKRVLGSTEFYRSCSAAILAHHTIQQGTRAPAAAPSPTAATAAAAAAAAAASADTSTTSSSTSTSTPAPSPSAPAPILAPISVNTMSFVPRPSATT